MKDAAFALTTMLLAVLTAFAIPTQARAQACDAEPVILVSDAGVEFVRTPDSCFEGLPDWPFEPRYVEIDGLRQAYVDEGPSDGPVVLLLHGQPTWSYLYRKMIPILAEGGYRVIAMDHLGMGRSDKPIELDAYSYLGHNDRLERFIQALDLRNINLFVQDWGSLIGMRVAGLHPEWFARIAVGNGILPVYPEGIEPFPPVENPDEIVDIPSPFAMFPDQQVPFYDGCDRLIPVNDDYFGNWIVYAMTAASFHPAEVVEASTWFDISPDVEAAYDAPFPNRTSMAGPRVFPSLINHVPGQTEQAWNRLAAFGRPFLTLWASNDPGAQGSCEAQQSWIDHVPGAAGQPHDRLTEAGHFLQDDQGEEIATRLVDFYATEAFVPTTRGDRYCEILLFSQNPPIIEGEIWGSQGFNQCSADLWDALDPAEIQAETGALAVLMNGPRLILADSGTGTGSASADRRFFGGLEMGFKGTLEIDPDAADSDQGSQAYTETVARRTAIFVFNAGEEIYELTSPDGVLYVMKSVAQTVDPNLALADLPTLGSRLALPDGWSYTPRTLTEDFFMIADGEMINLQDEFQNTYQRITPAEATAFDEMYFAPGAARASGSGESFFLTDAVINNRSDTTASYVLRWLPRDDDNSDALETDVFSLDAGQSAVHNDVVGSLFGLPDGALGTILVASDSPDLLLMTRTANQADSGTYGQGIPGIAARNLIPQGQRMTLVPFVENDDYRSNLGLLNGTGAPITISWDRFTSDGTLVGSGSVDLPPWGNTQINRVFSAEAPVEGGSIDVWTDTPGGSFAAYGSLLDNRTSDPTTILPQMGGDQGSGRSFDLNSEEFGDPVTRTREVEPSHDVPLLDGLGRAAWPAFRQRNSELAPALDDHVDE